MNEKQLQLVNFEQSKRLKQLGFDYPCFEFYYEDDKELAHIFNGNPDGYYPDNWNIEKGVLYSNYRDNEYFGDLEIVSAPPVALALKWFGDEKSYTTLIHCSNIGYYGYAYGEYEIQTDDFDAYEQAESALLDELLEILENNNN